MAKFRIIGDVHGAYDGYLRLTEGADYSLQVGDMGFDFYKLLSLRINSRKHKFFGGNHCNYDQYYGSPHVVESLWNSKDYGLASHGGLDFFFVRGGFSIDWKERQNFYLNGRPKSYWDNEELSLEEMEMALNQYKSVKPDIIFSHECPRSVADMVGNAEILRNFGYNPDRFTTKTSELLEIMFQFHKPKMHVFGHYHKSFDEIVDGTRFVCLPELGFMDLEV